MLRAAAGQQDNLGRRKSDHIVRLIRTKESKVDHQTLIDKYGLVKIQFSNPAGTQKVESQTYKWGEFGKGAEKDYERLDDFKDLCDRFNVIGPARFDEFKTHVTGEMKTIHDRVTAFGNDAYDPANRATNDHFDQMIQGMIVEATQN